MVRRRAWIGLALTCSASVAVAQEASPRALQREARIQELEQLQLNSRLRANTDVPAGERALIDVGGYTTANYLSLDDSSSDSHTLRQYDLVGYARIQLDGANEFFLRGRTGYRDFNPGDSFDGLGDQPIDADLDRAYYRFDLNAARSAAGRSAFDSNLIVKGGRDLAYWANGLVLATVLDGLDIQVQNPIADIELLGGVTITRTVDFDLSRPAFDHNTRRGFFGAMASKQFGSHRPFIYGLLQRDYNKHDEQTLGAITTKYDYNSAYVGFGSSGNLTDRFLYSVEIAFEFGDTLSNSFALSQGALLPIPQTRDDIYAMALDARLDYIVPDAHQSRLAAEVILASGDPDRGSTSSTFNGNKSGTDDHAFNSLGLVNTGLAFAPSVSNLAALRLGASTFPLGGSDTFRRLQVGADFFVYGKMRRDGPIDEQTHDESYLGVEPDLYLNWQVVSDVTVAVRYGAFVPNSAAFVDDNVRHFIYAGVTFAF